MYKEGGIESNLDILINPTHHTIQAQQTHTHAPWPVAASASSRRCAETQSAPAAGPVGRTTRSPPRSRPLAPGLGGSRSGGWWKTCAGSGDGWPAGVGGRRGRRMPTARRAAGGARAGRSSGRQRRRRRPCMCIYAPLCMRWSGALEEVEEGRWKSVGITIDSRIHRSSIGRRPTFDRSTGPWHGRMPNIWQWRPPKTPPT